MIISQNSSPTRPGMSASVHGKCVEILIRGISFSSLVEPVTTGNDGNPACMGYTWLPSSVECDETPRLLLRGETPSQQQQQQSTLNANFDPEVAALLRIPRKCCRCRFLEDVLKRLRTVSTLRAARLRNRLHDHVQTEGADPSSSTRRVEAADGSTDSRQCVCGLTLTGIITGIVQY